MTDSLRRYGSRPCYTQAPLEHQPRLSNAPSYPQGDRTPLREQFAEKFGVDVEQLFETPSERAHWPIYDDGRPKPIGELTEPERRGWFARGLRAMLIAYEVADASRHRSSIAKW
jgi:hypothetical protein